MFCNSCGKEVSDSLKFCAYCGASMNSGVPVAPPTAPVPPAASATPPAFPTAPVPPVPAYGAPAAAPAKVSVSITLDKVTAVAAIAVLAALTLVTMLLGWFTQETKMGDEKMVARNPVFTFSSSIGTFTKFADEQLKEMKKSDWYDDDDIKEFKKEMAPLRTANVILWIVKILLFVAIFALLAAIFLIIKSHPRGALVAQAGFSLVILGGIIALIFAFATADDMEKAMSFSDFGPSIWLWLTIIVSGLGMALTTLKKNVLKGA